MSYSFTKSFATLGETVRENFNFLARCGTRIDGLLASAALSRPIRHVLYATTAAGAVAGAATWPVQSLGLTAFVVLQLAPFMRDNRIKRGTAVLGCILLAPQMYLLNAPVALLQTIVAGSRAQAMNVIDDDSYRTRAGISAAFWVGAIGVSCALHIIKTPLDILPLAAMSCATIADACPDKATHVARLMRTVGAAFLTPYHVFVSGSIGGIAAEIFGGASLIYSATQYDVPVRDEHGAAFDFGEQLRGWARSLKNLERIPAEQARRLII